METLAAVGGFVLAVAINLAGFAFTYGKLTQCVKEHDRRITNLELSKYGRQNNSYTKC